MLSLLRTLGEGIFVHWYFFEDVIQNAMENILGTTLSGLVYCIFNFILGTGWWWNEIFILVNGLIKSFRKVFHLLPKFDSEKILS